MLISINNKKSSDVFIELHLINGVIFKIYEPDSYCYNYNPYSSSATITDQETWTKYVVRSKDIILQVFSKTHFDTFLY